MYREAIEATTPVGIATGIARLITSGRIAPGSRLPTVRDLAAELGVSPATVSTAWRTLAGAGLIESRGRSGTTVRSVPADWLPSSWRELIGDAVGRPEPGRPGAGLPVLDLSLGMPDPALLPRIERAGLEALRAMRPEDATDSVGHRLRRPDIPALHDFLRETWPGPLETLTVTNGALDAIDRAIAATTRFGDRVVLEDPTFPPFLDLAAHYGLDPIRVPLDGEGLEPTAFAAALRRGPALVLLQPRANNPTGISTTARRAERLGELLRRAGAAERTVVIEDDHAAGISRAPAVTLASHLPDRVLHVRGFSKSHGPDLRVAAIGGARPLIDRIVAKRLMGPGWTSRLVQETLFRLLIGGDAVAAVERARDAYARRQRAFTAAMAERGVPLPVADGINAWVPVADEREALVRLAAAGIRVAGGGAFRAASPHVRVTVGVIAEADIPAVATVLAGESSPTA